MEKEQVGTYFTLQKNWGRDMHWLLEFIIAVIVIGIIASVMTVNTVVSSPVVHSIGNW